MGGAVGFEGPDLHLAQALAAELGLAAQGLLRDQRVRPDGAGVDLVIHQVVELEHVDEADGDFFAEGFPGAAVAKDGFAGFGQAGLFEQFHHIRLLGPVEDRRGDMEAQFGDGPAQVRFEDLAHVHAGGDAQGIENDVDGGSVFQMRHVFHRDDAGNDALVPVASRHFVADGQALLLGDIDLDHLQDAGGQVVTGLDIFDLFVELLVDILEVALVLHADPVENRVIDDGEFADIDAGQFLEIVLGQGLALGEENLTGGRIEHIAGQLETREGVFDALPPVILQILGFLFLLGEEALDGAFVLGAPAAPAHLAGENLDIDHGAFGAGVGLEGDVLHVLGALAEDGAQEFFDVGGLHLALGRDLPDENVTRLDRGADADDAVFVEVLEGFLADVGDVPGDFLLAQFGIPRLDLEFLDVDLTYLKAVGASSLTDRAMQVKAHNDAGDGIPDTYVPFRNANLLSVATSFAEARGADAIYIGVQASDYSGYPDCRPEFIDAFQKVITLGTRPDAGIILKTPFVKLNKAEILKIGMDLNVPYEDTWSCYAENEVACGICGSCHYRLEAFRQIGIQDPIPYR